ncbi:right-handed parallel beta-helix repeat-containing protein, partial [bacterium]|nr:right-handed parallel beta-helix repeat-containing protein [bacterium]
LVMGSTRTDGFSDQGITDLGFHYEMSNPQPTLMVIPSEIHFHGEVGSLNPPSQEVLVSNYGIGEFTYTVSNEAECLAIFPPFGGPVPPTDTLSVFIDIGGLVAGSYQESFSIIGWGAAGSPVVVPVHLDLDGPILFVNPDTLEFTAVYGGQMPLSQTIEIRNQGIGMLNLTVEDTAYWSIINPVQMQVVEVGYITVMADQEGLEIGSYSSEALIVDEFAANSPDTVVIILNVVEQFTLSGSLSGTLQGGIEYQVIDDIEIEPLDSLVIQPGASLLFAGDYEFKVFGYLNASGTINDSIYFAPIDSLEASFTIRIEGIAADSSLLEYCNITDSEYHGLFIDEANPSIRHCNISNNGYGGIYIYESDNVLIEDCQINHNSSLNYYYDSGGGIFLERADIVIRNCVLIENTPDQLGGAITCYGSDALIENCIIQDNHAGEEGGGISVYSGAAPLIYGTVIWSNESNISGGGVHIFSSGHPTIDKCTFIQNQANSGSGIFIEDGSSAIIRNTIFSENYGSGCIRISEQISPITYCDFYEIETIFSGSIPPNLGILSQTNANGDSCDVYNNIFMDPLFYATSGDSAWRLTANSPCIDAGDPLSPFDPDSTIADMGAYYFHHELGLTQERQIEIPDEFCLLPAYPNPFNPATTIRFGLPTASEVSLVIYNIRGEKVADLVNGYRLAGYHEVTWEAGGLASGMYVCRIQAGEFNAIRKVILVK